MIFLHPPRPNKRLTLAAMLAVLMLSLGLASGAQAAPASATPAANTSASNSPPAPISQNNSRLGQSTYDWFLIKLYTAELWAPTAVQSMDQLWQTPFALSLTYDISIRPAKLAQVTLEQMEHQAPVAPDVAERWVQQLTQLYPPIAKGTTLIGLYNPAGRMALYCDGKLLGELQDGDFAKRFFQIWLDARSSYPKNRLQLLGWKGGVDRNILSQSDQPDGQGEQPSANP
ncbi:MAG: chalcone isomerase family protein [Holosporaceae bacterium]